MSLPGDQRGLIFRKNTGISSFTVYIKSVFIERSDVTLTVFESLGHREDSHKQDKD